MESAHYHHLFGVVHLKVSVVKDKLGFLTHCSMNPYIALLYMTHLETVLQETHHNVSQHLKLSIPYSMRNWTDI